MTKSDYDLHMLRKYLVDEYMRLCALSNRLLDSYDDSALHDYTVVCGERNSIARVMGYMGMLLPDIEDTEC